MELRYLERERETPRGQMEKLVVTGILPCPACARAWVPPPTPQRKEYTKVLERQMCECGHYSGWRSPGGPKRGLADSSQSCWPGPEQASAAGAPGDAGAMDSFRAEAGQGPGPSSLMGLGKS